MNINEIQSVLKVTRRAHFLTYKIIISLHSDIINTMVVPVPKKHAFRNIYKQTTGRVLKACRKPKVPHVAQHVPLGQIVPTPRRPPGSTSNPFMD